MTTKADIQETVASLKQRGLHPDLLNALPQVFGPKSDIEVAALILECLRGKIHPVFQRFNGLSPADHVRMAPALTLASQILTSPRALLFWHALFFGRRTTVIDREGRPQRVFHRTYADVLPPAEGQNVLRVLQDLARGVCIGHQPLRQKGGDGMTHTTPSVDNGLVHVDIDSGFLDQIKVDGSVESDDLLVQWLYISTVLVHEMTHAFGIAFREPGCTEEEFFEGDLLCELGHALERWVFGAKLFRAREAEGAFSTEDGEYMVASLPTCADFHARKPPPIIAIPSEPDHYYFIERDWIHELFLDAFWEETIFETNGLALMYPKDNEAAFE